MTPTVYVGQTQDGEFIEDIRTLGWGRIWSTATPSRCYPEEPVALDNGAYSAWRHGKPWDGGKFLARLQRVEAAGIVPDWVVIPDVIGDARASLARSWKWSARLPTGWPMYLGVQDEMTDEAVGHFACFVDGIFLGGLPSWQHATASHWIQFAHDRGLKAHWGGVGRMWELRAAIQLGFDSLDSAQMLWSREHWERWKRLWRAETQQVDLPLEAVAR